MLPVIIAKIKYGNEDITLKLPCKDSVLEAQRNRLTEDEDATLSLSAIEPKGLVPLTGLEVDLDELNFLAKSMERFDEDEEARFLGAVQLKKGCTMQDMINLSFNLEHYTVVRNFTDLAQIGKNHLLSKYGCITKEELETLDFARIGRKLLASGRGVPTDFGLLFENEDVPIREVYDGTTFPCYISDCNMLAVCTLQYQGKTEYLYLPEEEISIEKALGRLGADSLEDCQIDVESGPIAHEEWVDYFTGILEHEGLEALNSLASTLDREDVDLEKLTAVVSYADAVDSEYIQALAKHLDDFTFIPKAETDTDIGHYFVDFHDEYRASPELNDFIDFSALGAHLRREFDGQWQDNGLVCMEPGCSLAQILDDPAQDQTMGGL